MPPGADNHSQRIAVEWDGEWWTVSDEGGEFARATEVHQALRYVADLMHGPPTSCSTFAEELTAHRHGKAERLRPVDGDLTNSAFGI